MPVLTILGLLAASFYVSLGLLALGRDRRSTTSRVFAAVAGCFALWVGLFAFLYAAPDALTAGTLNALATPFWSAAAGLVLHFALLVTRSGRPVPRWTLPVIYAPGLVALGWLLTGRRWFVLELRPGPWGWVHDTSPSLDWFAAFLLVYVLQLAVAAFLVVRWRSRARLNRERRQATTILASGLAALLLGFLTDVVGPLALPQRLPVLSPLVAVIWFAGMAWAMGRHRLMTPVPVVRPEQIVNGTSNLLIVVDADGKVLEVNRRIEDFLGRPGSQVLGRAARRLAVAPDEGARVLEGGPTPEGQGPVTLECAAADGTPVPIGFHGIALADPDGDPLGVLFIGQDLRTDVALRRESAGRSEAERGLAVQRALVEAAMDSISDGVLVLDNERRIRLCNSAAAALCGMPVADLVGRRFDDVAKLRDEATGRTAVPGGETTDGGLPERAQAVPPVLILEAPDGRSRLVERVSAPLRMPVGEPGLHVVALRDVTERRRAEADLARVSRLQSLGVLAAGIAHDFNNSLTAVVGYLSMARLAAKGSSDLESYLARTHEHVEQTQARMRQLLAFSRGVTSQRQAVDLGVVLCDSIRMMSFEGPWLIELVSPPAVWPTQGDAAQFRQVFDNLLLNARQAMPSGGKVAVEIANVMLDESGIAGHPMLKPGAHVRVRVTDEGPGIPPERRERIFDPFYTTKPEGTGLGLSTVYAVVSGHKGAVEALSRPGPGTTFEILLPALPS